jgi:L-aminopeptidase/D-esterase-like protein
MIARRTVLKGAAALIAPALAVPGPAEAATGDPMMLPQDDWKPAIIQDGVSFDLPGVRIGTAEYREGPTGCSVFHFPERAVCEVDARGGGPGLFGGYPVIDALFLSGGSLYGLEVGSGVASELLNRRRKTDVKSIAFVSGAIIYDFLRRDTLVYPDKRLGAAAFRAAAPGRYPVGPRGAGCSASVGQIGSKRFVPEPGGQGCAVGKLGDAAIGVFTVANPLGAIFSEDGKLLRGYVDKESGQRHSLEDVIRNYPKEVGLIDSTAGSHTTITAVIIDKKIPAAELRQFGRQVHASMAQVIRPFHTPLDGDILFSVSVSEEPLAFPAAVAAEFASGLARRAIYSAVLS